MGTLSSVMTGKARPLSAIGEGRVVVYHSSPHVFTEFNEWTKSHGIFGPGVYFAEFAEDTKQYGEHLYEVTVQIDKPLYVAPGKPPNAWLEELMKILEFDDRVRSRILNPPEVERSEAYEQNYEVVMRKFKVQPHPFVVLMEGLELRDYSPAALRILFQHLGFDSIIVAAETVRANTKFKETKGDYLTLLSSKSIVKVKRLS